MGENEILEFVFPLCLETNPEGQRMTWSILVE